MENRSETKMETETLFRNHCGTKSETGTLKSVSFPTLGLTDHEIVGNVFILFAAGFETTATTIMWAMYELARDPELQTMMQEEAREVDATNYGDLTPDKMPLICSMINEVLRVHAPVGVNARRCVQSTTINGHHIKKGISVISYNNTRCAL